MCSHNQGKTFYAMVPIGPVAKILQVQTNIFKHKKLAGGQCSVTVAAAV